MLGRGDADNNKVEEEDGDDGDNDDDDDSTLAVLIISVSTSKPIIVVSDIMKEDVGPITLPCDCVVTLSEVLKSSEVKVKVEEKGG